MVFLGVLDIRSLLLVLLGATRLLITLTDLTGRLAGTPGYTGLLLASLGATRLLITLSDSTGIWSQDSNKTIKIASFQVLSLMNNDLVIEDTHMYIYPPVVRLSYSSRDTNHGKVQCQLLRCREGGL